TRTSEVSIRLNRAYPSPSSEASAMALVRCPIHKIPYNDENPRGCPACALEKEGGGEAQVMQELARAVQGPRRTTGTQIPPAEPVELPRRSTGVRPVPDGARR